MNRKFPQKGQALIIIVFAIIGLIGITALAIDGGNAFADKRHAQSAADTAALAGALAILKSEDENASVYYYTNENGYPNDGIRSTVTVNHPPSSVADCDSADAASPYDGNSEYIQVVIHSNLDTFFAQVIGITQMHSCVEAIAHAIPPTTAPPFNGNAVVGLDPTWTVTKFGFDTSDSATHLIIRGSGVFSNGAAHSFDGDSVLFPDGDCATTVGPALGFSCTASTNNTNMKYNYPADIIPLLPPIPACTGTAELGADGKMHEEAGYEGMGSVVDDTFIHDYAPGIYCLDLSGTNTYSKVADKVLGNGVTFYLMNDSFIIKFTNGSIQATAPTSGIYKGVLVFSHVTPTPMTQKFQYMGNGSALSQGTIFLPSASITVTGNSATFQINTQIIGYRVNATGSSVGTINYNDDDVYHAPIPPRVELTR